MRSTSLVSTLASSLSLLALAAAAACSSAPPSETVSKSGQASTLDPAFAVCAFDSDCVAVPQAGCCPTGWLDAVSSCAVDAYEAANACVVHNMMCTHYLVNDTRVAICDDSASACKMVDPGTIRCGGDSMNAHSCPSGFDCVPTADDTASGNGMGTCTQHVDPNGDDAGTTTAN